MKKIFALALSLTMILCVFGGCAKPEPLHTIDLGVMPTNEYLEIDVTEVESYTIKFLLPEDGYLKLLNCDVTEYEYWDTEIWPEFYVTFKNAKGKVLYENIATSGGYCEKYRFEKGEITAEIRIDNKLKDMTTLALSWAWAPDTDEPVPVEIDGDIAAARINADGLSVFSFCVYTPGVYSFYPTEACIYEGNCKFWIENADGETVTGELSILGTEWATRRAFLPEGKYLVKVKDIDSVASCRIRTERKAEDAVMDEADDLTAPVTLGFTANKYRENTIRFNTADGEKLIISPYGTGNFYENEHTVYVEIKDAQGNTVETSDEECDDWFGTYIFEFDGYSGEYTATISTQSSCVVDVEVE